jgi:hypothetical protein
MKWREERERARRWPTLDEYHEALEAVDGHRIAVGLQILGRDPGVRTLGELQESRQPSIEHLESRPRVTVRRQLAINAKRAASRSRNYRPYSVQAVWIAWFTVLERRRVMASVIRNERAGDRLDRQVEREHLEAQAFRIEQGRYGGLALNVINQWPVRPGSR